MCFLRSVLWLAVLPQSRHCHTLPLTFLVSEATWSSMAARKKQWGFKALTLFGNGIDHQTSRIGWTIGPCGRQSNAFEGLFLSWTGQNSDNKGKDTGRYKCECFQCAWADPASDCGLSNTSHTSSTSPHRTLHKCFSAPRIHPPCPVPQTLKIEIL